MESKLQNRRSKTQLRHVLEAVVLLSSDMEDNEVVARLLRSGCSVARAWKLVVLVPMAFARVVFRPAGVVFEDHYLVLKAGAPAATRCKLSRDPIYPEALRYAERLAENERVLALFHVLRRGADYAAIQALHRNGVPLQDIRLNEPGLVPAAE